MTHLFSIISLERLSFRVLLMLCWGFQSPRLFDTLGPQTSIWFISQVLEFETVSISIVLNKLAHLHLQVWRFLYYYQKSTNWFFFSTFENTFQSHCIGWILPTIHNFCIVRCELEGASLSPGNDLLFYLNLFFIKQFFIKRTSFLDFTVAELLWLWLKHQYQLIQNCSVNSHIS